MSAYRNVGGNRFGVGHAPGKTIAIFVWQQRDEYDQDQDQTANDQGLVHECGEDI